MQGSKFHWSHCLRCADMCWASEIPAAVACKYFGQKNGLIFFPFHLEDGQVNSYEMSKPDINNKVSADPTHIGTVQWGLNVKTWVLHLPVTTFASTVWPKAYFGSWLPPFQTTFPHQLLRHWIWCTMSLSRTCLVAILAHSPPTMARHVCWPKRKESLLGMSQNKCYTLT